MSALLKEVASILAEHGALTCVPDVDEKDGQLLLTLRVPQAQALVVLSLRHSLEYLSGLAQVRAFADQYGMDAEKLEALLPPRETS